MSSGDEDCTDRLQLDIVGGKGSGLVEVRLEEQQVVGSWSRGVK